MKKLLIFIIGLFTVFGSLAQETKADLKTRFDVIRNETVAGANTKTRIANAYQELADASQGIYYIEASGTATYTASLLNLDAYADKWFVVQFLDNNTGSSTLNINSLGAVTIKKEVSTNLSAGDIDSLSVHILAYDGTNFQIMTLGGGAGLVDGDYGDVTVGGTGTTMTIDNSAVTFAKIQNADALSVVGRSANSSGVVDEITASATGQVLRYSGSAVTFGAVDLADTDAITGVLPVANLTAKYILDRATPSTAGGTITLDMNSQIQRMHVGSASFSTAKIIALSNTTNSLVFSFSFTVTDVAAVLTMPSDFVMSSIDWDGADWTPPSTGNYEMGGSYDGTNWIVKIAGPFN